MRKTANLELENRSLDLLLELFCDEKYARYRFSADFLRELPTKVVGLAWELKFETDNYRIWITWDNMIVIEKSELDGWEKVLEYNGSKVA